MTDAELDELMAMHAVNYETRLSDLEVRLISVLREARGLLREARDYEPENCNAEGCDLCNRELWIRIDAHLAGEKP